MKNLKVFTDGGSRGNPGPAGLGGVVFQTSPEVSFEEIRSSKVIHEFSEFIGTATNNEAEYLALLKILEWLGENSDEVETIDIYLDSKLVVEQINRNWKIKDERMQGFAIKAWKILSKLNDLNIKTSLSHVKREKNKDADALVNQTLDANLK
jgi:ribonuclease HI